MSRQIYVETTVATTMDAIWAATQDPAQHQRWDLRFGSIDYLPREPEAPQRFRYALRVAPRRIVAGTGVAAGERWRPDGTCTSALRFSSTDPLSLIRDGAGWWRYIPAEDGIHFITGFDYRPGWGRLGVAVDRLGFRRLVGWLTACSFDRLRLWLEHDVPPERSRGLLIGDAALRASTLVVAALVGARGRVGRPGATLLAVAALTLPARHGVPRADRCRRRPRTGTTVSRPSVAERLRSTRWNGHTGQVGP